MSAPLSTKQKIAEIRENVRSMDAMLTEKAQLNSQRIVKLREENQVLANAIQQREQKIRELGERLQQKDDELQELHAQAARKRSLPPMPPVRPEPEFVDEDDRLAQLRMLQKRLEVAQEEVGSKEIILRMLRESIAKTGIDYDTIDLQIHDIDSRLQSFGRLTDPEATARLEKIKRLDEKLEKVEQYLEQFIGSIDQSRGPLRQASYRPQRSEYGNAPVAPRGYAPNPYAQPAPPQQQAWQTSYTYTN